MSSAIDPDEIRHSLRYLCKKDKNRVRKLIVDVATGDRKIHEVEEKLHVERDKFRRALLQLNQHIILLERERIDLQRQLNKLCEDHAKQPPVTLSNLSKEQESFDSLDGQSQSHHQRSWTLLPPLSVEKLRLTKSSTFTPFDSPTTSYTIVKSSEEQIGLLYNSVEESSEQKQNQSQNDPLVDDASSETPHSLILKQKCMKTNEADCPSQLVYGVAHVTDTKTVSSSNNAMGAPLRTNCDSSKTYPLHLKCRNISSMFDLATSLNCESTHKLLVSHPVTNQCEMERDEDILQDLFFRDLPNS